MKRLAALLAILAWLWAAPALATGIAIIAGTGTGGALCTAAGASGASTSLTCTTTATVAAGDLVVIAISYRTNAATVTGCTDQTGGNTWLTGASEVVNQQTTQICYSYLSVQIPSGDTVQANFSSSANGKGIIAAAFSGTATSPFDAASITATGSSTGLLSVGPTGTLACPGAVSNCEVLIAMVAPNNNTTPTHDSNFTSLGFQNSGSYLLMEYKIVSASTAITWQPTLNGTSAAWAAMLQGFKTTGGVTTVCTLGLLGAGC